MNEAISRRGFLVALGAAALTGCGRRSGDTRQAQARPSAPLPASGPAAARLNAVAEKYWDDYLALHPLEATALGEHRYDDRFGDYASLNWMADRLAIEQDALDRLGAIDRARLDADEALTFDLLRTGCELRAEGFRYPSELLAVDPVANLPVRFAVLASGQGAQQFGATADYEHFLARMDGFVAWVDQAINNLRSGVAKGVVYPRSVVERTLPPLAALGVAEPRQSLFWQPILNFPPAMSVADRRRLTATWHERVGKEVLPGYRRLHHFLKNEYLPQARTRPGMDQLPAGDLWYGYLVRCHTGSRRSPAEVHELGLSEVARLRADAERLMRQGSAAPDLRSFAAALRADEASQVMDASAWVGAYRAAQDRVRAALPLLFAQVPRMPLEVRPVEPLRAAFADAVEYRGPLAQGAAQGVLYVNAGATDARSLYLVEARSLGEGLPGRHLQAGLAFEHREWPRLRRMEEVAPQRDGWALYAQSLGRDLGLYADEPSYAGHVLIDLWMSARLVVDTGLHAKGWSREQAMAYLRANTGLTEEAIAEDVDRSLAAPGRGLSHKMGQLQLVELRERARQRLGARFDIRAFHAQVSASGSLPPAVLEAAIERWLRAAA